MKKRMAFKGLVLASVLLLSACQGRQKEEARLTGIERFRNKDYTGAIQSFEEALELAKGKVGTAELDVLKYRAEAEYLLEDYAAAAHTYEALLQVDADYLDYHLYRCMALAKSGQLESAVAEYRIAAEQVQTSEQEADRAAVAELLVNLGPLLDADSELSKTKTVADLYQEAIDAGLGSAFLYNRLGLNSLNAGELDQAISLFEAGLALGDSDVEKDLLYNQAVAYERKLEFAKALDLFERYTAEFGTDPAVEHEIDFLKKR